MSENKYWFKRKRYGWGWFPVTIQGWALVAANVLFILGLSLYMFDGVEKGEEELAHVLMYLAIVALSTTLMILIARSKSPAGKWRWGKKESDDPEEDF